MLSEKEKGASWSLQTSKLFPEGNCQGAQTIQTLKSSWKIWNNKYPWKTQETDDSSANTPAK